MKRLIKIVVACGLLLGAGNALAQDYDGGGLGYGLNDNTDAGTVVSNTATVSYEVNGVEQEEEINNPAAQFVVDRVILINVANTDALNTVTTAPSAEDAYLTFLVTNDSNATIDLLLSATQLATEDFDASSLEFWVDANDNGIFDPANDTDITLTMLLESVTEGTDVRVFVVGDIPSTATVEDGDDASIILMATAYETDGTTLIVETNVGDANEDDPMEVDTVFGDLVGTHDDDDDEDGQHSDTGTFTIGAASITVAKTSVVVSDPFNGTTNPKAIPGAVVLYCIEITNTGGTDAINVSVKDPIPNGTTYVPGSIEVFTADIACSAALVGTGLAITDTDADDGAEATANSGLSGNSGDTDLLPVNEVAGSTVNTTVATVEDTTGVAATIFRVTIN